MSYSGNPARTVPAGFLETVSRLSDRVALRWRTDDGFGSWTWAEYADQAARIAAALASLGVERGDRVVLMLRNSPEFHIVDMGALLAGATPVSIYNSSSVEQIGYLVNHCEATIIVTEPVFAERVLLA